MNNLNENILEQCSKETNYYPWSGLDLTDTALNIEQRIDRMSSLIQTFCSDTVHEVQKFANKKETKLVADKWMGYSVHLHYPKLIPCTGEVLSAELKDAWPTVSRLWFNEVNNAVKERREPVQLAVFKEFISSYSMQYFNVCRLLLILISTPANTSCIERAFTYLVMDCTKRWNHLTPENVQTLFLLAALKIAPEDVGEYGSEIEILEKEH